MQGISIKTKEDFEKLRNLKGKETIYVTVDLNTSCSLEAISLKNFSGTIELFFPRKTKATLFRVKSQNEKKARYFFTDIERSRIGMNGSSQIKWDYIVTNTEFYVKDEKEIIKHLKKDLPEISFHLEKDMVFNTLDTFGKKVHIIGDGHRLFWKKPNTSIDFQDTKVIQVDDILKVRYPKDLKTISKYQTETVVVSFQNSICYVNIDAISLFNFTGTMYVLGNGYAIRESSIRSSLKYLGLFSIIHPYTNLYIEDLNLEDVILSGKNATVVGGFLGMTYKTDHYMSYPGHVVISNCKIKDSKFLVKSFDFADPIIGLLEENQEVIHCDASHILFQNVETKEEKEYSEEQYVPYFHSYFSNYMGAQNIEEYKRVRKL